MNSGHCSTTPSLEAVHFIQSFNNTNNNSIDILNELMLLCTNVNSPDEECDSIEFYLNNFTIDCLSLTFSNRIMNFKDLKRENLQN